MIRAMLPILLVGCSADPSLGGTTSTLGEPDIEVLVGALDFGEVRVGVDEPSRYELEIHNRGTAALTIDKLEIADASTPFEVDDEGTLRVPPDSSRTVQLSFDPGENDAWDTALIIHSDDPDSPEMAVGMQGTGLAPRIAWTPDSWELDTTWIGCEQQQEIAVQNIGSTDLLIVSTDFDTSSWELGMEPIEDRNYDVEGLMSLDPGESTTLTVMSYAPQNEVADTATLTIVSDDPQQPEVVITADGDAAIYGTNTDSFEIADRSTLDLIIAVDRSSSMDDILVELTDHLVGLVEHLGQLELDFQLAVTQHDSGCIQADQPWIDGSFSEAEARAALESMIDIDGPDSTHSEAALTQFEITTTATGDGACNAGLMRDEAELHLVGISDEAEQSEDSWSSYVSAIQSIKGDADLVTIHAIGGDYPSGCGDCDPYTGMYEASVATGGEFLSLCTADIPWILVFLASKMTANPSSFELTATPIPDSIEVRINDTPTSNWQYSDVDAWDVVHFEEGFGPTAGDTLDITYSLQPPC